MSLRPEFQVADIGKGCHTVNDRGRTVAIVTSQGYIDWLLQSPLARGGLVRSIPKETHLSYVLGLKLMLTTPTPETWLRELSHRIEEDGARLVLCGRAATHARDFTSETTAVLACNHATGRYEWELQTIIACTAEEPVKLPWIEYNNVYPGKCGRCMLFAPTKEYNCTLMVDRDGAVWRFPHQHLMHYSAKISRLHFAVGTMGGFFGEHTGNPVVVVTESNLPPDWAICDMYYDLHCGARPDGPIQPGRKLTFRYQVKYLGAAESKKLLAASKPIPVDKNDWTLHTCPRLELGLNSFSDVVHIDRPDDASGFRPAPPVKVWDRETGHRERGSLRITNTSRQETVWSGLPPTQIPAGTALRVTGMVRTKGVEGKGALIRVRYFTFVWHPTPHVEWVKTLDSPTVTGSTPGWVQVTVPELQVPPEHFDYLIYLDVVLDGRGVAWFTDVDVDLQPLPGETATQAKGSARQKGKRARAKKSVAGSVGHA